VKILNHKLTYGPKINGNNYKIFFLGDVHLGNIAVDRAALKNDIAEIAAWGPERAGIILMGDLGDYISPFGDRRFDQTNVDPEIIDLHSATSTAMQTVSHLVELFEPVGEQVLAILGGNHGLQNKADGEYTRWEQRFAEDMGLDHLFCGYSAFVRLQFEAERSGNFRTILCHVHHGWQGGRTKGAKVNQLAKDVGKYPGCDFVVRGHDHDLWATPYYPVSLNQRGTDIVKRKVITGHSGTYLEGMVVGAETYTERADYPLSAVGCLKTWIRFTDKGYELFAGV